MMSTLLSFTILALSLCRLSEAALTNTFQHLTNSGGTLSPIMPTIPGRRMGDFSVATLPGKAFAAAGPPDLPARYRISETLPYQAFPGDQALQEVGSQYLEKISNRNYRILSEETKKEWEACGDAYEKLSGKQKERLDAWLKTDVIGSQMGKEDREKAALCVDWSVQQAKSKNVWWNQRFIKQNAKGHDFIKVVEFGNILKIDDKKATLSDAYVIEKIPDIITALSKNCQHEIRNAPLNLKSLSTFKNEKGTPLYLERIDQAVESLFRTIQTPSASCDKNEAFEALYLLLGDSPTVANRKARAAIMNVGAHDFEKMTSDPKKSKVENIQKCLDDLAQGAQH